MKILQITPTYPPAWSYGGITRVVYEITLQLCKRGHEVEVWTTDALDLHSRVKRVDVSSVKAGAKIRYFKNLSFVLTSMLNVHVTPRIFISAERELHNFDIIHLHGARTFLNVAMYLFLKKNKIPYVLQAHGSLSRIGNWRKLKWIYDLFFGQRLLKDASKVIALSPIEAEQYRRMGVPEEKIAIIPNGIDLSEYASLPPRGCFKKKFGIKEEEKIVLYLGRIHRGKGIDFLVKAYAYIIKEMKYSDVLLVIAGPDDGYLNEAKLLVNSLRISDKVLFTGMLSEKEKIIAYVDSSIIVNVEPKNVFGLVPLEAAACSTPVIVCEGNAIKNIIHQGMFGFSVKYGDINELAEIMFKMLHDDKFLREMGQKGRKFVFENFDWVNVITKFENVYEKVCSCQRNKNL